MRRKRREVKEVKKFNKMIKSKDFQRKLEKRLEKIFSED
jgi:hypothetical protein